jgi:hypothetical protein
MTVTEALPDITLENILTEAWMSEHMNVNDWYSLVIQMMMLPYVNQKKTTVIEMSVSLDAYAVKFLCHSQSIDYGHIQTPMSKVLLVKQRWDAPLPT